MGIRRKPKIIPGDPWMISDISGHPMRRSEAKKDWRGLFMTKEEWSHKEEQLTIQVKAENPTFPDARPRQIPDFIEGQANGDKDAPSSAGLPPGLSFEPST